MRALRACVFAAISALLMMVPTLAHGQTLTAMWDPNPPSDAVTSYEICVGTTSLSCNFQLATVAGGQTSYTFAPSPGVLYRVAVRSVNAAGPGPYSDEVTTSIPGLTQPANQSSQVNVAISPLSLSASDPDGGTIQFTHSGLPFGLSLNQSTGIITGTPTSPGTSNVTIFVSDDSVTTSRSFVWTVTTGSTSPTSPANASTLSANRTSPQPVGTTVTFSAGASGGTGPYSYKWWVKLNGGAWTLLQDWSTSTTLAWTPNASGTYAIGIWARSNGVTADSPQTSAIAEFGVSATSTPPSTPPPTSPANASTLSADRTSPQPVGTTVTFSAGASGGASPYSYKWWVRQNGGEWTLLQDWSTSTTLAWTPNASGTYAIGIWARSNGVTADGPQTSAIAEFGVSGTSTAPSSPAPSTPPPSLPSTPPPTYASLAANRTSPQPGGTTVTFSAGASGGASPYSYKWWVKLNGGAWTLLQDWSPSTTLAWTPNASGTYAIGIWARSNGVTADSPQTSAIAEFDVSASLPLSPPPSPFVNPPTSALIGVDRPGPQPAGTALTFSASASGGASPYSYKWWVKLKGGEWTVLRDWNASATLTLTPTMSGTYVIGIWARSNGVTADSPQTSAIAEFGVSGTSTAPSSPAPSTPPPSLPSTPPPTYASLAANRTSPQPGGTTVTFSAGASGGASPYSYKWWVKLNGGAWTLLQDWSPSTTLAWTPNASGTYAIGIWARSNGVTADSPQTSAIAEFDVSASLPLSPPPSPFVNPPTSALIGVDRPGPQPTGTALTFSASASGGASPYSYKWWVKLKGGEWTVLRDWNASATLTLTPTMSGTYVIGIWARSNGVTADMPQTSEILEFSVTSP